MKHRLSSYLSLLAAIVGVGQAATSTSSAPATTHTISVGAEGFQFTPNVISAVPGDMISFLFYPSNHSVARADFEKPCYPYEDSNPGRVGFWSGFNPLGVVPSNPPSYNVLINDTSPIFFYCSAPGACKDEGMVGVINPNSSETFAIQQAYAKNASFAFSPGEPFPSEGSSTSATPTSTSISASTSSTATTIPTPTQSTTPALATSSSKLSTGAIAGIAVGAAAIILMAGILFYFCGRQRTMGEVMKQNYTTHAIPPPSYLGPTGHMSMSSNSTYPFSKAPHMEIDPLQIRRFSGQGEIFNRNADTESYRSRSPPINEKGYQNMSFGSQSPSAQSTPITPGENAHDNPAHDLAAARLKTGSLQNGPHELPVETQNEQVYAPYHSPETNNEARFSANGQTAVRE